MQHWFCLLFFLSPARYNQFVVTVARLKIFARCHENCESVAEFRTLLSCKTVFIKMVCCKNNSDNFLLPPYIRQCRSQREIDAGSTRFKALLIKSAIQNAVSKL